MGNDFQKPPGDGTGRLLPVWIDQIQAQEYQIYEHFLTKKELELEKERIHQKKRENFVQKGVQILENSVRILAEDSGWIVQGEFLLEEQIGTGKAIVPEEIEQSKESEAEGEQTAE